jgi:hypothetical protein
MVRHGVASNLTMTKERTMKTACWAMVVALVSAAAAVAGEWQATGAVTFASTVTRGPDFAGKVSCQPFVVTEEAGADGQPVWSMVAQVPVAGMTTDEKGRDKDMRKMLEGEKFAVVSGTVAKVPVAQVKGGQLPLVLSVSGVAVPVVGQVSRWHEEGGRIAFEVRFPVSLKAHGRKAPTMMFMKVDDVVQVTVQVALTKGQ